MDKRALCHLATEMSTLLDTGANVSVSTILSTIREKKLVEFLMSEFKGKIDIANIADTKRENYHYGDFVNEYENAILQAIDYQGDGERKWGIKNNGLCLVLSLTIQIIRDQT